MKIKGNTYCNVCKFEIEVGQTFFTDSDDEWNEDVDTYHAHYMCKNDVRCCHVCKIPLNYKSEYVYLRDMEKYVHKKCQAATATLSHDKE